MNHLAYRCIILLAAVSTASVGARAQQGEENSSFPTWIHAVDPLEIGQRPDTHDTHDTPDTPGDNRGVAVDAQTVRRYVRSQPDPAAASAGFRPWWQTAVLSPFELADRTIEVGGDALILETLRHSHHVAAVNETVVVARTGILRAAAEFDPTAFLDSRFVRTSVPTGSALDAGIGVSRLREEDFSVIGGLRRKTENGAQFEFNQQLGLRDSNSLFFTPPNQGNSQLTLSFNQPVLAGAGKAFNRSLIVLAELDTNVARQAAITSIQDHLIAVQEAFWELYFHRVSLVLRIRHLEQASNLAEWIGRRQQLDAMTSQVKRAEAAIASRRSELSRAIASIRNAEDQLRALVNSPDFSFEQSVEIIPAQPPSCDYATIELGDAVVTAISTRSEINEVARELEAARVRLRMARNELLPVLDVILESYLSGLRGEHNIPQSWLDQFSVGEPSYSAGFRFEVPLQRRAAKANITRRQAQIRQLSGRLQQTIAELHAEVATAVRDVETAYRELQARVLAMRAAGEYLDLLDHRWRQLAGDNLSSTSVLEDLLDAHDRLLAEELAFAASQTEYAASTIRLKRATGTLLQID